MLVRVLEIPPPTGSYHFGGGERQTFVEVDWFRDDDGLIATPQGREQIIKFIVGKRYFDPNKPLLVLHQEHSFTIGYKAP